MAKKKKKYKNKGESRFHGYPDAAERVRDLWCEVIRGLLKDYAYLKRLSMYKRLKKRSRNALLEAEQAVFSSDGALVDIANAIAKDPSYLISAARKSVSDEKILANKNLDRKMRRLGFSGRLAP